MGKPVLEVNIHPGMFVLLYFLYRALSNLGTLEIYIPELALWLISMVVTGLMEVGSRSGHLMNICTSMLTTGDLENYWN